MEDFGKVILVDFDVGGILTPPDSVDEFLCFVKVLGLLRGGEREIDIRISAWKNQIYEVD